MKNNNFKKANGLKEDLEKLRYQKHVANNTVYIYDHLTNTRTDTVTGKKDEYHPSYLDTNPVLKQRQIEVGKLEDKVTFKNSNLMRNGTPSTNVIDLRKKEQFKNGGLMTKTNKRPRRKSEIIAFQKANNLKADGVWGKKSQTAYDKKTFRDAEKKYANEMNPKKSTKNPLSHKNIVATAAKKAAQAYGLPVNQTQFIHDILGGTAPLTHSDLSKDDMKALRELTRHQLSKGKSYIDYPAYKDAADRQGTEWQNLKADTHTNEKLIESADPLYRLKTTLGRASINVDGRDTLVTDTYDFNDAPEGRDTMSVMDKLTAWNDERKNYALTKKADTAYKGARSLGKWFGSSPNEGGGSDVRININEEADAPYEENLMSQESTRQPVPQPVNPNQFANGGSITNLKDAISFKQKFMKYFEEGGDVSQASPGLNAMSMVSAIMPIVQTTVSGIQDMNQETKNRRNIEGTAGMRIDSNPFMRAGGRLSNFKNGGGLKHFNGPSHEQGGIPINQDMVHDPNNATAEVEGGETGFELEKGGYIFSDKLGIGDMTFADHSKKIDSKFKREDGISKRTKSLELESLSKKNDFVKEMSGMLKKYMSGGSLEQYAAGGYTGDPIDGSQVLRDMAGTVNPYVTPVANSPQINQAGTNYNNPVQPIAPIGMPSQLNSQTSQGIASPRESGIDPVSIFEKPLDPVTKREPFNYNKIALGLKGAALGKSFMDSIQPTEQERLQLNPYADEAIQIAESQGINNQSVMNQIDIGTNLAMAGGRRIAGSAITNQVLGQSAIDKGNRAKADAEIKEQQVNSGLRNQEGQIKAQLGSEEKQARLYQQTTQSQNDAANRGMKRDLYSNMSKIGSEFNKKQYTDEATRNMKELATMSNEQIRATISAKYSDFDMAKLTEEDLEKLKKGDFDMETLIKYRK